MSSSHATYRTATIRNPNGTPFGRARYKFLKKDNHCVQAGIWVDDIMGKNLASAIYPMRDHREGQAIDSANLPGWLTSPSTEALHHLASLPDGGHDDNPNLVAFAIHRRDGALVTRLDFDASGPYGLRFDLHTVPVILPDSAIRTDNQYAFDRKVAAANGFACLLGFNAFKAMNLIEPHGDVYDPDNGRFISVCRSHLTLEDILERRWDGMEKYLRDPSSGSYAIKDSLAALVKDTTALRTGDLTAEMAEKLDRNLHFTPQLRYIAAAIPTLLPQPEQAAA